MPKKKTRDCRCPANYIVVRGKGNPNEEGGVYQQAIRVLYAAAYTLKMSYKTDYIFFRNEAGLYEDTTKEQLKHYLNHYLPDDKVIFLAADPDCKIKGIGTALLHALEEKKKEKQFSYIRTMHVPVSFTNTEVLKEKKKKKSLWNCRKERLR